MTSENKTPESQRRANQKWHQENKAHSRYLKDRSAARSFVRHKATKEDMAELIKIFKEENENGVGK